MSVFSLLVCHGALTSPLPSFRVRGWSIPFGRNAARAFRPVQCYEGRLIKYDFVFPTHKARCINHLKSSVLLYQYDRRACFRAATLDIRASRAIAQSLKMKSNVSAMLHRRAYFLYYLVNVAAIHYALRHAFFTVQRMGAEYLENKARLTSPSRTHFLILNFR